MAREGQGRRTRWGIAFGLAIALLAGGRVARAGSSPEYFESGSIIIPMDECHQFSDHGAFTGTRDEPFCYCPTGSADDGVIKAYGLIYRLLQNGVTVKVIIDGDKTAIDDVDMTVRSSTEPVKLLDKSSNAVSSFYNSGCAPAGSTSVISYRGAPFVIPRSSVAHPAGGNALLARSLMQNGAAGTGSPLYGAFAAGTFSSVDVHVATVGFVAEVALTLAAPTPVALNYPVDQGDAPPVFETYLSDAGLDSGSAGGDACTPGEIYGRFDTLADYTDGCLDTGGYNKIWATHWAYASDPDAEAIGDQMTTFLDASNTHAAFFECESVKTIEQTNALLTTFGTTNQPTTPASPATWNYGTANDEGWTIRDVANPLVQKGDLALQAIAGTYPAFRPFGGSLGYRAGTTRLATTCGGVDYDTATHTCKRSSSALDATFLSSKSNWDLFATRRRLNDPSRGLILYLASHRFSPSEPGSQRFALNTLLFLDTIVGGASNPFENVRSSPVVAEVNGVETQFLGTTIQFQPTDEPISTFNDASDYDNFEFPYRLGHLRAHDVTDVDEEERLHGSLGEPLWDAADWIAANGPSRRLFTHSASYDSTGLARPDASDLIDLNDSNAGVLDSFLDPGGVLPIADATALLPIFPVGRHDEDGNRIGALGGIDRSTVAVIGPSSVVPDAESRPTIVYAGSLDGMLHAFCAEDVDPCTEAGQELWAYAPPPQVAWMAKNLQRMDGSPKVADLFGDFDGDDVKEWKTVLVMTSGAGDSLGLTGPRPTVTAIDVSDPATPSILWERQTPLLPGLVDLGVGMTTAVGQILVGGTIEPAVIVETNNGGLGGAGIFVQAYRGTDGEPLWASPFTQLYGLSRNILNPVVPPTGIPGGVAALSSAGTGLFDFVMVPTLYGDLWELSADTGTSVYGADPLFSFATDLHPIGAPPTLYRAQGSGTFYAVVVSGGYVDQTGSPQWVLPTDSQFAVSVRVMGATDTPISDISITSPSERPFVEDLGTGQRGFAQATVAGDELFITTSDVDVNQGTYAVGSGMLRRYSLSDGGIKGSYYLGVAVASAAEVVGGVIYVGGTTAGEKIDVTADNFDAAGVSLETSFAPSGRRELWIKAE